LIFMEYLSKRRCEFLFLPAADATGHTTATAHRSAANTSRLATTGHSAASATAYRTAANPPRFSNARHATAAPNASRLPSTNSLTAACHAAAARHLSTAQSSATRRHSTSNTAGGAAGLADAAGLIQGVDLCGQLLAVDALFRHSADGVTDPASLRERCRTHHHDCRKRARRGNTLQNLHVSHLLLES
jgi:hypothetical protein